MDKTEPDILRCVEGKGRLHHEKLDCVSVVELRRGQHAATDATARHSGNLTYTYQTER